MGLSLYLLFNYIAISYHEAGWVRIQLTGLTQPYFRACPNPGPGFPSSYVLVFLMFNYICFVDIGGIVDHHCLNVLFYRRKRMSIFRVDIFFY